MSLTKQLEQIGFSAKEAKIYVALLELGEATALQLATKTELNRATTYVILENLLNQGLVNNLIKKKKTCFIIESPRQILDLLNKEKTIIDNKFVTAEKIMSEMELLGKLTQARTKVKFYEGKAGIQLIQKDILKSKAKSFDNIFHINEALKHFPVKPDDHRQSIVRKNIKGRTIVIYDSKKTIPKYPTHSLEERKYLPGDKFSFLADFTFYKNKAAMISYKDNLMGVIIENKALVDGLKVLFELAWQGAEKYQSLKK